MCLHFQFIWFVNVDKKTGHITIMQCQCIHFKIKDVDKRTMYKQFKYYTVWSHTFFKKRTLYVHEIKRRQFKKIINLSEVFEKQNFENHFILKHIPY